MLRFVILLFVSTCSIYNHAVVIGHRNGVVVRYTGMYMYCPGAGINNNRELSKSRQRGFETTRRERCSSPCDPFRPSQFCFSYWNLVSYDLQPGLPHMNEKHPAVETDDD